MFTIEKNDALLAEAERLGLETRRKNEPEASTLLGRYDYNGETGVIVGPRGKPLKPSENRGVWRVGVWVAGKTVAVMVGRLAFAIQHQRWPVGVSYVDKDTTNHCAANLKEVESRALKVGRALASGRFQPQGVDLDLDLDCDVPPGFPDWETFEAKQSGGNLAGAWHRGRFIPDELNVIADALKYQRLSARQRIILLDRQARFEYRWNEACKAAAAVRVQAGLPGFAGGDLPEPKESAGRVRGKGPTLAQKKAAGVSRSPTGLGVLSSALKNAGWHRRSRAGKKRGKR